jgi:hypothetical protein
MRGVGQECAVEVARIFWEMAGSELFLAGIEILSALKRGHF